MPHILLFSGGTACRSINLALSRQGVELTRVVPSWDSGGSSKGIRDALDVLSVGDIRQALMTMAYGEGRVGDVVKICNARVSLQTDPDGARSEFEFYASGAHPSLLRLDAGLRGAIRNYLQTFETAVGEAFDYRNCSIGNAILTGAYLAHNRDVNTAIFVFRKICDIAGNVWPSSLDDDAVLSARLKNGTILAPQDAITNLSADDAEIGIRSVSLRNASEAPVHANPAVIEAIRTADLIVFGPGSPYTSVLPHLLVEGIAEAVEAQRCAKVFIGNILQCRESTGADLGEILAAADDLSRSVRPKAGHTGSIFTHVLANRVLFPFAKTVGAFPYLDSETVTEGVDRIVVRGEFEDAWSRGQHDGEQIAERLRELALTRAASASGLGGHPAAATS